MVIRRLIVLLTFAAVAFHAGQAFAQGIFPAPLPGQAATPASDASPLFPPVTGSAFERGPAPPSSGASDACMKGFVPLREEAVKRGRLIRVASDRHARPDEACKLIESYGQSEIELIKYIEANSTKCGISPQVADQLKAAHKGTEAMQKKVCDVAQQTPGREPAGPVGDFDDYGAPRRAR